MDSLNSELQIVFYFQLFLSANISHGERPVSYLVPRLIKGSKEKQEKPNLDLAG